MAPAGRNALIWGPLAASMIRGLLPVTLVLVVGFVGGASLPGGVLGIVMLYVAALGVAFVSSAFALGLAYRMRTIAAATLTQFAIFFTLFLSTAQMPLDFIKGWVKPIARVNPATNILRLAREGFLGHVTWESTWGGLVAIGAMSVVTTWFAKRGLETFDK
jgi:ABC-2 type transport system permease protein